MFSHLSGGGGGPGCLLVVALYKAVTPQPLQQYVSPQHSATALLFRPQNKTAVVLKSLLSTCQGLRFVFLHHHSVATEQGLIINPAHLIAFQSIRVLRRQRGSPTSRCVCSITAPRKPPHISTLKCDLRMRNNLTMKKLRLSRVEAVINLTHLMVVWVRNKHQIGNFLLRQSLS